MPATELRVALTLTVVPGAERLPVSRSRLGQQIGHVRLDRPRRQEKLLGDRRVRQPGLDQPEYVELTAGHADRAQVCRHHRVAAAPAGPGAGAAKQFTADPAEWDVSLLLVRGQIGP